jgi:predicted CXXCH cytochrome family protein
MDRKRGSAVTPLCGSPRQLIAGKVFLAATLGVGLLGAGGCQRLELSAQGGKQPEVNLPAAPARETGAADKSAECMACHTEIEKEFASDAHKAGDFSCVTCHGTSKAHLEKVELDALPERTWRHWDGKRWVWRVPEAGWEVARFCASCHADERADQQGAKAMGWKTLAEQRHGQALQRGSTDAPTCTDCHAAHGVSKRPWQPEEILELCAPCHGNQEMMKRARVKESVIEDFRAGTHGTMPKVTPDQQTSCLSCHHPHAK